MHGLPKRLVPGQHGRGGVHDVPVRVGHSRRRAGRVRGVADREPVGIAIGRSDVKPVRKPYVRADDVRRGALRPGRKGGQSTLLQRGGEIKKRDKR